MDILARTLWAGADSAINIGIAGRCGLQPPDTLLGGLKQTDQNIDHVVAVG